MTEIFALILLIGAAGVLVQLSRIDLRIGLLPNKLVLTFLILGVLFHLITGFAILTPIEMALGVLAGGGFLYGVRAVAKMFYTEDPLGLGDVKLLGAAGVWLGPYSVLVAIVIGALAGIAHGLLIAFLIFRQTKTWPRMNKLSLPAGPGFAAGILITGALKFWPYRDMLWP